MLVDGVSSQRLGDRSVALQRLAQSGAFLATSEMVGEGGWEGDGACEGGFGKCSQRCSPGMPVGHVPGTRVRAGGGRAGGCRVRQGRPVLRRCHLPAPAALSCATLQPSLLCLLFPFGSRSFFR